MEQELLGKWQVHEVFTKGSYPFSTVLEVVVNTASGRILCATYKLLTYLTRRNDTNERFWLTSGPHVGESPYRFLPLIGAEDITSFP